MTNDSTLNLYNNQVRKGGGSTVQWRKPCATQERGRDILTIFLFVRRFGVNGIKWKTRLSRNGKISDSQCIHFFLALAFRIALKKKKKIIYTNVGERDITFQFAVF